MERTRATNQEIHAKLNSKLGVSASECIATVVNYYQAENKEKALSTLAQFDEEFGTVHGVFAHIQNKRVHYDQKDRAIYRQFLYIYYRLDTPYPERFTRDIVRDSCLHIEGIIKRSVRLTLRQRIAESASNLPMGSLLRHRKHKKVFRSVLVPELYDDVLWLNDNLYIFDKHGFSAKYAGTMVEEDNARLFELDEALAVYFIARHMGINLMHQFGMPPLSKEAVFHTHY